MAGSLRAAYPGEPVRARAPKLWWLLAVLGPGLLAAGCDRRVEPWIEADREPPPPERPVRIPGLGAPAPRQVPMPEAASAPGGAGPSIRGELRLAEGATVPAGGVLFVIARSEAGGPPLAVKRLAPGAFPMRFEIGAADAMMAGRPFAGPIRLSARIDADGDPLTRSPEDVAGELEGTVEPGATGAVLELRPAG